MKVQQEYQKEKCNQDGQLPTNLTASQKRGISKLLKKVKNREIVICQTDKTGKLVVISFDLYMEMGAVHTANDKEIDLGKVKELEEICNGHVSSWMKIFNYGVDWKHQARWRENRITHSLTVPDLELLYKDHKGWTPDVGGPPPSRPLAKASKGINVHLSDIVSEFIEPLATARKGTMEVISTDDFLSKCDGLNKNHEQLKSGGKTESVG